MTTAWGERLDAAISGTLSHEKTRVQGLAEKNEGEGAREAQGGILGVRRGE